MRWKVIMINKNLSDELLSYFERCLIFYESFLQIETNKYNDVVNDIISALDQHVKDEEVYMLKAKGLEIERSKLIAQTENPEVNFRELIPLLDDSVREQARQHYEKLSAVLLDIKEVNQRCNHLTELKLHQIQNYLKKLENPNPKTYNNLAQETPKPLNMVSRKV